MPALAVSRTAQAAPAALIIRSTIRAALAMRPGFNRPAAVWIFTLCCVMASIPGLSWPLPRLGLTGRSNQNRRNQNNMTNPVVKAYLDNNIVSAIAKNDTPDQSDALDRLLAAYDEGRVDLVTSELTHQEIKDYRGDMRPQIERIFRLLEKLPIIP